MVYERNESTLNALNDCVAECNHCAAACLEEHDVAMLTKCIKLNIDCADVCQLTASLIARGSEHAQHLLKECVEICNACATECEQHSHMEHCRMCAQICRQCAEACSHMEMAH
jgi:hypothetical protein